MEVTTQVATALCEQVVEELVGWSAFPAVVQVGGIESRASSRILRALERWLEQQKRTDLLVLPEYRLSNAPSTDETTDSLVVQAADKLLRGQRIDYALVKSRSVGLPKLEVDTVIEVKTNYLCQTDLRKRPLAACDQARFYGERCGTRHTYVLYVVVSPLGSVPDGRRDAGWGYFRKAHPSVSADGPIDSGAVQVLGQYPAGSAGYQLRYSDVDARIWACMLQRRDL